MIRAGFHPADWIVETIGARQQYRCTVCRCTYGAPETHKVDGERCREASRERSISRSE